MADDSARLFIIDQTLKDFQGHHFEYDAAIAQAATAARLSPVIVANRKYQKTGAEPAEVVPWFQAAWTESITDARLARSFWGETLELFESRALGPDDIALVHTVSIAEFQQIVDFYSDLLWSEVTALPSVFVILRRDPDEYSRELLNALRLKLRRVYEIPDVADRLALCSDTDLLSEGWGRALQQPVLTLPIPFRHSLVDGFAKPRRPGAPAQVVYLGDARNEKGYQHFPAMAQALWPGYVQPGKVEITLQSNFNMPGGEGGIPQARLKLQRYPHGVTLITEPLAPEPYYEVLAKADIVVLPYDPKAYARRSSGVLNEAVSAGKVVVAPKGSWLAAQLSPERSVTYKHPGGLAEAVIEAVERLPELSRGAAAYQAKYRAEQNPEHFVQALQRRVRKIRRAPAGSALYVMDGDSVVNRTGAGSVARQQMQALVDLGFRVHAVFQRMHVDEDHNIDAMRQWMDAIREEVRELRLASVWGAGHAPFYRQSGAMSERQLLRSRNLRLDADAHYRAAFSLPAGLLDVLRSDPPRFALVNYVQSVPLARRLAGPRTPLICETHDIQAFQFALRNPQGYREADLDLELKLLGDARHVIALNRLEADFLSERLGRDRVTYIAQPVSGGPARLSKLAGARDLAELVCASGSSHPAFDARRKPAEANGARHFRQAPAIDLLYVSSSHGPNLEGLKQFLHHVFYARLIERGVTLAVAGSICDDLKSLEGPQVLLAHRVRDLEPLYAAAKMVILPILDGAGSAIKTIEAMARARPVVATSFAMRGVDRSSEPFPVFDDWSDFGDRILTLLDSEEERLAAAQAAFRLSLVNGNDGGYAQRLGRAVGAALGPAADLPALEAGKPAAAKPPARLTEWSESIRRFNALSVDYLTLGYIAPEIMEAYREAPLDLGLARELFAATVESLERGGAPPLESGVEEGFARLMQYVEGTERAEAPDEAQAFAPAGIEARVFAYDARGGARAVWRSGEPKAPAVGLRAVELPRVTPGMVIEQIYEIASAPRSGLSPCIALAGVYDREEGAGPDRRWTGPETTSTFLVTVSRRYDAELCLRVHDALDGAVYEHAFLEVDGQTLPTLKWSRNDRRMLVAIAPAAPGATFDRMAIALHVPRTLSPSAMFPDNKDTRKLGLGLGRLELRSQITSAPVLEHSLVAQSFATMAERDPADIVYGGYRDLLRRDPDSDGHAHYVGALSERRMTGYDFFRDLIGSDEFRSKFSEETANLLGRYLGGG